MSPDWFTRNLKSLILWVFIDLLDYLNFLIILFLADLDDLNRLSFY